MDVEVTGGVELAEEQQQDPNLDVITGIQVRAQMLGVAITDLKAQSPECPLRHEVALVFVSVARTSNQTDIFRI
eukprot:1918430-Rhodomonas_salina.1